MEDSIDNSFPGNMSRRDVILGAGAAIFAGGLFTPGAAEAFFRAKRAPSLAAFNREVNARPLDQRVDTIVVWKKKRLMQFFGRGKLQRSYLVQLGSNPTGHKQRQGDGRTPEGRYVINRKNPQSSFHRSIGISYPNRSDRSRAARRGVSPGGDIFIHGQPNTISYMPKGDWTRGCIAVPNHEMDEIFKIVPVNCPIYIYGDDAPRATA